MYYPVPLPPPLLKAESPTQEPLHDYSIKSEIYAIKDYSFYFLLYLFINIFYEKILTLPLVINQDDKNSSFRKKYYFESDGTY